MAQNITINGENFQSVPSVVLPKTGGGSASFIDTTDATATSSEILQGYTAYGADGTKLTGTATAGITPAGTISIDDEGTYDVTNYASAEVDIDYSSKVREITFVINRQNTSSASIFSIYGTFGSTLDFSQGIKSIISSFTIAAGESTKSYTIHCPKQRPIIVVGAIQAVGNYDVTIDSSYGECVDVPHILGSTNTAFTKAIYLKAAAPDALTITITFGSQAAYPESVVTSPLSVTANGTYTASSGTAYNEVTVNVPPGSVLVVDTPDSHGGTIREITSSETFTLLGNKTVTPSSEVQIVTANETPLNISTSENTARGGSLAYITTNIQWQSEPVVGTTYNVVVNCTVNGRNRTYDYDGTVVWNGYGSTSINMHTNVGVYTPVGTFNETTFVIQHSDVNGDTLNNSPITIQMYTEGYDGLAQVTVEPVTKLFVQLEGEYDGSNSHYVSYKGAIYNQAGDSFVVSPKDTITIVGTNSHGVTIYDMISSEELISGTGTVTVDYEVKHNIWVSYNSYDSQSFININQFEPYLEIDANGLSGGVDTVDITAFTSIEPFDLEEAYDEFTNSFINPVGLLGRNNYYYSDYSTNSRVEWECYVPANAYVFVCITMNPIGSIPSSWLTSFRPLSSSEYEVKKVNGEFFVAIAFTYRQTVPSAVFTIYEDIG